MTQKEEIARNLAVDYIIRSSNGNHEILEVASTLQRIWNLDKEKRFGTDIETLLSDFPGDQPSRFLMNSGNVCLGSGDFDTAIENISAFLEDRNCDNALLRRAAGYLKQSRYEEALDDYNRVLESNASDPVANAAKVFTLWSMKWIEEATRA